MFAMLLDQYISIFEHIIVGARKYMYGVVNAEMFNWLKKMTKLLTLTTLVGMQVYAIIM